MSWSPVTDSSFPNPGASIEAIRLANGHWALVYNDNPRGRHSLAVSLSENEGTTWKWTRHLASEAAGKGQFHYPSVIEDSRGLIDVTYTLSRSAREAPSSTPGLTRAGSRPAIRIEVTRDWRMHKTSGRHPSSALGSNAFASSSRCVDRRPLLMTIDIDEVT